IGPDGAIWITNNGGAQNFAVRDGLNIPDHAPEPHAGGMLQRYDPKTGALTTVYDAWNGRRLVAPNDLVFDREGGVWFTDHGCRLRDGRRFGGVYYARLDG